jgi:hypothetical protein
MKRAGPLTATILMLLSRNYRPTQRQDHGFFYDGK